MYRRGELVEKVSEATPGLWVADKIRGVEPSSVDFSVTRRLSRLKRAGTQLAPWLVVPSDAQMEEEMLLSG